MKYVLALIVTLALTGAAPAQHAHGNEGPNGGQLQDVDDPPVPGVPSR